MDGYRERESKARERVLLKRSSYNLSDGLQRENETQNRDKDEVSYRQRLKRCEKELWQRRNHETRQPTMRKRQETTSRG